MHYDVFNGDADGLCALQQLRLAEPCEAELVTGVKRDIALLARLRAGAGDSLTVLDIGLEQNHQDAQRLLAAGARIVYFDHHHPGAPLAHPGLETHIDTAPHVCTGILVDRYLGGAHRAWAVAAAFGDNLPASARALAASLPLDAAALAALQELGECLNYNAYGETLTDLHVHPAELHRAMRPYRDPLEFRARAPVFPALAAGYREDLRQASAIEPAALGEHHAAFILPDAPWARRVSGMLANRLAVEHPQRAHAVLTPNGGDAYVVSVRAPKARPEGADELCRAFPSGGGRKAAAGINVLPAARAAEFLAALASHFAPSQERASPSRADPT